MNGKTEYIPSAGEEFLIDFFESLGIDYKFQFKTEKLKYDSKGYRVADFYLTEYNVYVEFLGLWNNGGNDEYREKKNVYFQNNIPCIYIYPENLGIIDFTFDKRIQEVLEKNRMKKELRKYHFFKMKKSRQFRDHSFRLILLLSLFIYAILYQHESSMDIFVTTLCGVVFILQVQMSYSRIYISIFKKKKFPLSNLFRWS